MEGLVPGRVEPTYRPSGEQGEIVVYAGDLDVKVGDEARTVKGQLQLRLAAGPLVARFAGPPSEELHFVSVDEATVSISAGSPLEPPPATILPEMPGDANWIDAPISIRSDLAAGEAAHAQRFIFHISGALKGCSFPRVEVVGGAYQRQLGFRLPGWDLVIAPVDDPRGEHDFGLVVEATPAPPTTGDIEANVDKLAKRLFILLSFMASREVGVRPICGLTEAGKVIWANWESPRLRPGTPGVRWCSKRLVASALPEIAKGFTKLSTNETMEAVVDRAIEHLLAADGSEALDVRVPVACTGLEMLGWAVLQHHGWVESDAMRRMKAAPRTRLLLQWAGVPATIPDGFDGLARRRDRHHPDGGGPEVLWGVRNRLVHPPKRFDSPEWPSTTELRESWQLATWYLELVVLRRLGYEGQYGSRLRLDRYDADVEPVPWAAGGAGGG